MIEAMKQALEALENASEYIQAEHDQRKEMYEPYGMVHKYSTEAQNLLDNKQAITSLRQAIEQAEKQQALDKKAENARELGLDYEPVPWIENMTIDSTNELSKPTAPVQEPVAYTTGHCKEKAKPNGCQLHNLHCGYPACDRKPSTTPQPQQAEKQEPVGEVLNERGEVDYISYVPPAGTFLYTTPQPQREFVGLTEEEIALVCAECAASAHNWNDISFARAIEAKLKEKNGL